MSSRSWRRSLVLGAALTLLGTFGVVGAAPALARPVLVALPRAVLSGLVATAQGVVVLSADREGGTLQRVDPSTGAVLAVRTLLPGTPTGNSYVLDDLVLAAGSLWVSEYWENEVLRLDPVSLRTRAVIGTGRSPSGIVSGGGSLWVPLTNDQAVIRIDPGSNAVVSSIPVGSPANYVDSPYKAAWTGTDLVTTLPASGRVAHISPHSGRVTYDHPGADATGCAAILPVSDGYWLDDSDCYPQFYRWTATSSSVTAVVDANDEVPARAAFGSVVQDDVFYTGEGVCTNRCTGGELVGRDLATGAVTSRRAVPGGFAGLPHAAAGFWWTDDVDRQTLYRSALTTGGSA